VFCPIVPEFAGTECCRCMVADIEGETEKPVRHEYGAVGVTQDLAILAQLLGQYFRTQRGQLPETETWYRLVVYPRPRGVRVQGCRRCR
jgi:hypothetical protein